MRIPKGRRCIAGLIGSVLALFLLLSPAVICADQVTLAWDPNLEPDIGGYILYYGTQSRNYDYDVDVGDYTSITISGLVEDVTYYFAVTAYDFEGNESDFSTEITYPNSVSIGNTSGSSGMIQPNNPAMPPPDGGVPLNVTSAANSSSVRLGSSTRTTL